MTRRVFGRIAMACSVVPLCVGLASCATTPAGEIAAPSAAPTAERGSATLETAPSPSPSAAAAVPATVAPIPTATAEILTEYSVQPGDTMLALASEWGVSMAAIQKANRLGGSTSLRAGAQLRVPSGEEWEGASTYWVLHVVQPGETLGHIARQFGLQLDRLVGVNKVTDANLISVGQELVLPLDTLAAYDQAPAADVSDQSSPEPPAPITTTVDAASAHEVEGAAESIPSPALPPADIAEWPYETVRVINAIRAEHGLPPYAYNETLAQAAQAHASDCVDRGWCSHTGSDGSTVKERILRVGYGGTGWAECWAQRQTPQGAVDTWMDEVPPNDPHRRMMLHTWFTEIGVGIAEAPWGYYFIADFGRP